MRKAHFQQSQLCGTTSSNAGQMGARRSSHRQYAHNCARSPHVCQGTAFTLFDCERNVVAVVYITVTQTHTSTHHPPHLRRTLRAPAQSVPRAPGAQILLGDPYLEIQGNEVKLPGRQAGRHACARARTRAARLPARTHAPARAGLLGHRYAQD